MDGYINKEKAQAAMPGSARLIRRHGVARLGLAVPGMAAWAFSDGARYYESILSFSLISPEAIRFSIPMDLDL